MAARTFRLAPGDQRPLSVPKGEADEATIALDWLPLLRGRTISSASWEAMGSLTVTNQTIAGPITSARVAGGSRFYFGEPPAVRVKVTLSDGDVLRRTARFSLRDR